MRKTKVKKKSVFKKSSIDMVDVTLKKHRDKKGGHHHVILETFDNYHVSVGLTSKNSKGKGSTNYDCKSDVLKSGKNSYMRRQGTVDKKSSYFDKRKSKMTATAFAQAKIYGQRAKEKFLRENKKR